MSEYYYSETYYNGVSLCDREKHLRQIDKDDPHTELQIKICNRFKGKDGMVSKTGLNVSDKISEIWYKEKRLAEENEIEEIVQKELKKAKKQTVCRIANKIARSVSRKEAFHIAWKIAMNGGYEVRVAGVSFYNRQEALRRLAQYDPKDIHTVLVPEADNSYDPNAIAVQVLVNGSRNIYRLGYVPRTETAIVKAFLGKEPELAIIDGDIKSARIRIAA
jgi:hypothetical protein